MPQNADWGGLKPIIQYLCCSHTRRQTWPEQSPELPPDLRAGAQSLRTQSQRLPRHWLGTEREAVCSGTWTASQVGLCSLLRLVAPGTGVGGGEG